VLSSRGPQRPGESDCLLKTQQRAKPQGDVYAVTPVDKENKREKTHEREQPGKEKQEPKERQKGRNLNRYKIKRS